jgi:plasmid segregation protein ParM
MNDQIRPTASYLTIETVRTETLPEGTFFVGNDDVLYQVVMAGSAGFRKAEPWPWLPRPRSGAQSSDTERPKAVALVPGSLLARNYPVVAEGKPLPEIDRSLLLDPDNQPRHYIFHLEGLAKLAAQLDEALAPQSGLAARKENHRWVLSDGHNDFRVYHYQQDEQGWSVDLANRLAEENIKALPCEQGPGYWQYIPNWEPAPSIGKETAVPSPEPPIEAETAAVEALEPVMPGPAVLTATEEPEAEPAADAAATAEAEAESVPEPTDLPAAEESEAEPPADVATEAEAEAETATEADDVSEPIVLTATEEPEAESTADVAATAEAVAKAEPAEPEAKAAEQTAPAASSSKARRSPAMILSIDIGYGYTKGVGPDGLHFSFPSVVGTAEDIRFATDLIRGGEEWAVKYGNRRFFYGQNAMLQSRIQSTIFDRSRVHDDTYKMLFIGALIELTKHKPNVQRLKVVTGLPVGFFGDRPDVVKSLEGVYRISTDRSRKYAVESVFVAPQPFGSLFRELLNQRGKITNSEIEKGRIGIIDVGTFTTDFVVSDELRYVQRMSGSVRIGWSKVINQVSQTLGDRHMLELMPHEVDQAIQVGEVRVRGKPVPLQSLVEPIIDDVEMAIVARARDLWGSGTHLDMVLVSGGGGPHLYEKIHKVYPHAHLLENAFWANAEGLYRFGQRPATFEKANKK